MNWENSQSFMVRVAVLEKLLGDEKGAKVGHADDY